MDAAKRVSYFFIVIFSAVVIGQAVANGCYTQLGIFFGIALFFLLLNKEQRFVIFSFAVFFPVCLAHLGPIPKFMLHDLLAPLMLASSISGIFYKGETPKVRCPSIFLIAISVFILWAIINYARKPVSGRFLFGSAAQAEGIRGYYAVFVGAATFFISFRFFGLRVLNAKKWLLFLCVIALISGYLRLTAFFKDFDLPFLGSAFEFKDIQTKEYIRIGGLAEMAALGITAILALLYRERLNVLAVMGLFASVILVMFSGGRASFFGVLAVIINYAVFIKPGKVLGLLAVIVSLILIMMFFIPDLPFLMQFKKFIAMKDGFWGQDLYRYNIFKVYWEIFLRHPVFGKGIGYMGDISISDPQYSKFISQQLMRGGHSAYLSIMAMFGLGGILFLLSMVYGGIFHACAKLKKALPGQMLQEKFLMFAFLYLVFLSISFVTGGDGFSNMGLWFLTGMVAGIDGYKT